MTAFAIAVERQQWPLVAHYLLLGVSEATSKLPAESLTALIDLLGVETEPARKKRHGR